MFRVNGMFKVMHCRGFCKLSCARNHCCELSNNLQSFFFGSREIGTLEFFHGWRLGTWTKVVCAHQWRWKLPASRLTRYNVLLLFVQFISFFISKRLVPITILPACHWWTPFLISCQLCYCMKRFPGEGYIIIFYNFRDAAAWLSPKTWIIPNYCGRNVTPTVLDYDIDSRKQRKIRRW